MASQSQALAAKQEAAATAAHAPKATTTTTLAAAAALASKAGVASSKADDDDDEDDCDSFSPGPFKPHICNVCFKTRDQHSAAALEDRPSSLNMKPPALLSMRMMGMPVGLPLPSTQQKQPTSGSGNDNEWTKADESNFRQFLEMGEIDVAQQDLMKSLPPAVKKNLMAGGATQKQEAQMLSDGTIEMKYHFPTENRVVAQVQELLKHSSFLWTVPAQLLALWKRGEEEALQIALSVDASQRSSGGNDDFPGLDSGAPAPLPAKIKEKKSKLSKFMQSAKKAMVKRSASSVLEGSQATKVAAVLSAYNELQYMYSQRDPSLLCTCGATFLEEEIFPDEAKTKTLPKCTCGLSGAPIEDTAKIFKTSADKDVDNLRFVGTNVHVQQLRVVGESKADLRNLWDVVTAGAMAAHSLGFKDGRGLLQLLGVRESLHNRISELMESDKEEAAKELDDRMRDLEDLDEKISLREHVCFSQALSVLLTSFASKIRLGHARPEFWAQLQHVGFAYAVLSLLSTWEKEAGMLGDMAVALRLLNNVTLGVHGVGGGRTRLEITSRGDDRPAAAAEVPMGRRYSTVPGADGGCERPTADKSQWAVHCSLGLGPGLMASVPSYLRNGGMISVCAVVFNQGINEQQTMANKLGKSQLQGDINAESCLRIKEYLDTYLVWKQMEVPDPSSQEYRDSLPQRLSAITHEALKSHKKNVKLLEKIFMFGREISWGQTVCCKSAKDRTSMVVTAEQARLLITEEGVTTDKGTLTGLMRATGVRRVNVQKNTGNSAYAFNPLQLLFLPKDYRPPKNTYSGTTAS